MNLHKKASSLLVGTAWKKKVDSLDLSYGTPPWRCDFMVVEASGTAGICGLVLSNQRELLPAVPSPGLALGLWGKEK